MGKNPSLYFQGSKDFLNCSTLLFFLNDVYVCMCVCVKYHHPIFFLDRIKVTHTFYYLKYHIKVKTV